MKLEVSSGEIADRLSILSIKLARIKDPDKLANVKKEHTLTAAAWSAEITGRKGILDVFEMCAQLRKVNERLWDVEDSLRACEAKEEFDDGFVPLARSVYKLNDQRAAIKRQINVALGSALIEEKSYSAS